METEQLLQCFVIAPIGKEGSLTRVRSDQILHHILVPLARECGYKAIRADQISEPGSITTQVIEHILNDPMLIADLTENNANVFYELSLRHALRKPYVQIIQKGERIPFDVSGIRTIEIDHTNLDSVASAREEIRKQIMFTAANPAKVESPISVAIDFDILRQSGDPEKRQLADVMDTLGQMDKKLGILAKMAESLLQEKTQKLFQRREPNVVDKAMARISKQINDQVTTPESMEELKRKLAQQYGPPSGVPPGEITDDDVPF